MFGRFQALRDAAHTLLGDANNLRRSLRSSSSGISSLRTSREVSLLASADIVTADQTASIIAQAEKILCGDFDPIVTTKLDGDSLAKIFLALAYSGATWSSFEDFFKIALLDSISNHHLSMSAKNAANILWALARMGCVTSTSSSQEYLLNSDIVACLLRAIAAQDSVHFVPQTYANVLWSFAVLDLNFADIRNIVLILIVGLAEYRNLDDFNECEISQLKDFFTYYHDKFPALWGNTYSPVVRLIDERMQDIPKPFSSDLHIAILKKFQQYCDLKVQSEHPIGGGHADIRCRNVIFEVNGPHHYDKPRQLNAHSLFRQRMMEKCGFTVFQIHYRDWERAKSKKTFICKLLKDAGLPRKTFIQQPSVPQFVFPQPGITLFLPIPTAPIHVEVNIDPALGLKRTMGGIDVDEPEAKRRRIETGI